MTAAASPLLVRAPNPGPLTGQGTNTWIYGDGEAVVIDPGPADEGHLARVLEAARPIGRVALVACTHHHLDHLEGADRLCQLTGAPLAVHQRLAEDAGALPLHHGDRLLAGREELLTIHTPGHSRDHVCFLAERDRILFTGDHVLQGTTSLVLPPDGNMADYLDSLRRVLELRPSRLLPGHGEAIEAAGPAIQELIDHRLEREAQILEQLREGPAAAAVLVPRLYAGYPEAVLGIAAGTVLAHLEKLEAEGSVQRLGAGPEASFQLSAGGASGSGAA